MIRLRRTVAILLAVVFVILSLPVLVAFRINATAANPDFYAEQLHQANIYHIIYDDMLPAAVAETGLGEDTDGASAIILPFKPYLVEMVKQALPVEWLQAQAEYVINQVVPYAWGETVTFRITVPLKDRVEAGAMAIKNALHREDVFPVIYEQLIQLIVEDIAPSEEDMPAILAISEEEMETMLRKVLPEDWLLEQIDSAVDEVVPYLTKEQEHLTLEINIARPLTELQEVLVDLLSRQEVYDSLFAETLVPAIQQNLEGVTQQLPIDVELTEDEIIATAREILPLEWYRSLVKDLVGQLFGYLRGEQDELELVIPLADRKPEIAAALGELADEKIASAFNSLPVCTSTQLLELLLDPSLENIQACRPMDISYQEFKELVGMDAGSLVKPIIEVAIPDEWILTEADISQLFGSEEEDNILSQIRKLVQEGLVFTEKDLNKVIDTETVALDNIRQSIADGLTFTDQDLKTLISDTREADTGGQMATFEQVRSGLGTAKKWLYFIWIVPFLLLMAVGALGGRKWSSKLIWAATLLAITAIIAFITFGPVFSTTAQPAIDRILGMEFNQTDITSLISEKGITLAHNAIETFISGLMNQSLVIIIVSVVLIGVGVVWYNWNKIRRIRIQMVWHIWYKIRRIRIRTK